MALALLDRLFKRAPAPKASKPSKGKEAPQGPKGAERWDETNKPQGYILGVTPGFAMRELRKIGFARKISDACRLGFEFAEVDFENLQEMFEPNLVSEVARVKKVQNIEVGVHAPVELDLCLAAAYEWKRMHDILRKSAYATKLIGGKFFLFHTSSNIRPHVTFKVGGREYPESTVSHDGINLGDFIEKVTSGEYTDPHKGTKLKINLKDWFTAKFIKTMYHVMGVAGDPGLIEYFDRCASFNTAWQKAIDERNEVCGMYFLKYKGKLVDGLRRYEVDRKKVEDAKNWMELPNDLREQLDSWIKSYLEEEKELGGIQGKDYRRLKQVIGVLEAIKHHDFESIYKYWREHGSECEESIAYRVIAKYMYLTKDPLWIDIVGYYDPDDIIKDADEGKEYFIKDTSKKVLDLVYALIAAVASKYIQGHLFVKEEGSGMKAEDKELTEEKSVYGYIKENKIQIFIETAFPMERVVPGELRIMHANDSVTLVKHLDDGEYTAYNLDTEHLTSNYIRVEDDINNIPEGGGKYIRMIHFNAPKPPAIHPPVSAVSPEMFYMYRWLWLLRQKGVVNTYLIWEFGEYGVDQSAIAFRNFKDALLKGIPPEQLPPETYGLGAEFEAAQLVAMREHAFDPLKGLIAIPEEAHGMIGGAAAAKGKGEVWGEEMTK